MSPDDRPEDARNPRDQALVAAVERAINEADPMGLLELGAPSDEYAPEIGTIVPRLAPVQGPDDIAGVLHEEFTHWFGAGSVGRRHAYEAPARRIWDAVMEYRHNRDEPGPG